MIPICDELLAQIDAHVQPLSDAVGFELDKLKFLLCVFASFPLSVVHRFIRSTVLRHVYSLFWGLVFGVFCFGDQIMHSLMSSLVVYFIVLFLQRSPLCPKVAFFFTFGYMTACHIYRQYYDYLSWKVDFTSPQMILTLKLVAFAFDTYDAQKGKKNVKFPTFLEFLSYIYYFPCFLAGPFFEFEEYLQFIDLSAFTKRGKNIPAPPFTVVLKQLGLIAICLVGFFYNQPNFPSGYIKTEEFQTQTTFWYRIGYIYLSFFGARVNYFITWLLSELVNMVIGFSYRVDEKGVEHWDRLKNIDVLQWEFAQNLYAIVGVWNIRVAGWLKKYIYLRVTPPGSKPGAFAQFATYATSAFWHGFYPGYYLFFLSFPFFQHVASAFRKTIRTFFLHKDGKENYPLKYIYDFASILATALAANYIAISFLYLELTPSFYIYKSLYFFMHIAVLVFFIISKLGLLPYRKIQAPTTNNTKSKAN